MIPNVHRLLSGGRKDFDNVHARMCAACNERLLAARA